MNVVYAHMQTMVLLQKMLPVFVPSFRRAERITVVALRGAHGVIVVLLEL